MDFIMEFYVSACVIAFV